MTKRIVINVAFFALIGVLLTYWAATNVISFGFIDHPYTVTAQFQTSPGLSPRFEVTFLGQKIGSVSRVALGNKVVTVTMKIDRDQRVPGAVNAAVRRKSAVGEPYIDLQPTPHTDPDHGPRLGNGDRIPVARTSTPLSYADLFKAVEQLVAAIEPADLRTLVHELAVGLDGRGDSLRSVLVNVDQLTSDLADNAGLLDATISDLTELTHTFATHRSAIGSSIDNLAALAGTLRQSERNVSTLLEQGPTLGSSLADLVTGSKADLGCTLDALGVVGTKLDATTVSALSHVIAKSPKFLFVLSGLLTDTGLRGRLAINVGPTGPLVYPRPLATPIVPRLRACGAAPATPAAGDRSAGTAGPSEGVGAAPTGSAPSVPGRTAAKGAAVPATPESTPTSLGGGLQLNGIAKVLVPLAAVLVLAAGVLAVRRRLWPSRAISTPTGDDGGDAS